MDKEFIKKFKKIYKKKEGKNLSNKKAIELANNLLLAFDAVYRPILKKDKKKLARL